MAKYKYVFHPIGLGWLILQEYKILWFKYWSNPKCDTEFGVFGVSKSDAYLTLKRKLKECKKPKIEEIEETFEL